MRKQYLLSIELKKSFWISVVVVILLGAFLYFCVHTYQGIMKTKTANFSDVENFLLESDLKIDDIHSIERFHGNQLYYVIEAENINEEALLIYVYKDEEVFQYRDYAMESFYTQDEILEDWKQRCTSCHLLGSNFGLLNENPSLEIKYLDDQERLVYEHVLLNDLSEYRLTLNPVY
ncbi:MULTISPECIES: hypothetical protein [Gracilibacillus]|uniref:hypothetical protein n=1 Tax=Gracilibacillus TaxID=74385 RepID=UPI0006D2828A